MFCFVLKENQNAPRPSFFSLFYPPYVSYFFVVSPGTAAASRRNQFGPISFLIISGFASHLRPMGLNELDSLSHLL